MRAFVDRLFLWIGSIVRRFQARFTAAENRRHLRQLSGCGDGTAIWGPVTITGHARIRLGRNVHIGRGAFIRAEGGLEIGDNTHISRNLLLYTMNHRAEGECLPYDEQHVYKPVTIGRNVWVGMNVCIAPGTQIGDGAIIGMGTVVSGTVPPMAIVASQKWRVVGERDAVRYARLDTARCYGGPNGTPYRPGATE